MGEVIGFQGERKTKRINYSYKLIKSRVYLIFTTDPWRTKVGIKSLIAICLIAIPMIRLALISDLRLIKHLEVIWYINKNPIM
jgi:hypothetical protein